MNNKKLLLLAGLIGFAGSVYAKTVANDSLVNNYMRSSLYTLLLNSDELNKYFEEETKKGEGASELMSVVKTFANTDAKKAANEDETGSIFALPAKVFPTIAIPNQFNDHNLQWRVINFDSIRNTVTDADIEKYKEFGKKKKKGAGLAKFAKGMAGMETAGDDLKGTYDKYAPAVINKFFESNNVAPLLIAKWYDYDPNSADHWGIGTVIERGNYNFTDDELKKAAEDLSVQSKIDKTAFNMVKNTYILGVNLRFRSYQAIVAEAAALAEAAGSQFGSLGSLAAKAASAGASAAAGDGYTVQAVTDLYRLKWNDDLENKFSSEIFEKHATLDDLIKSGICELEYVGSEKSSSNIRQSLLSDKPISQLVKRATARAIDEAIIKLQNGHEEFRTVLPILGGDGDAIYAAIGTKEGLNEKDEYEILEANEGKDGEIIYKAVGTVKPVKGKIWNNAYGAAEEVAENSKATEEDKAAVARKYSE